MWREDADTPEQAMLRRHDSDTMRRLIGELPAEFREVIVLREINDLSYRDIATVIEAPIGTVMSWFNGRLDVAPPVADLTAQGFTLLGGRLDYVDAKPAAAIVYRRRVHIINLFCAPAPGSGDRAATIESLHGFNVRRWRENGLSLWAVSDISVDELAEFGEKFEAALKQ